MSDLPIAGSARLTTFESKGVMNAAIVVVSRTIFGLIALDDVVFAKKIASVHWVFFEVLSLIQFPEVLNTFGS